LVDSSSEYDSGTDSGSDSSVGAVRRRLRRHKANKKREAKRKSRRYDSDSESEDEIETFANITPVLKLNRADDLVEALLDLWTPRNEGKGKEKMTV
jgi:hypothetical protein